MTTLALKYRPRLLSDLVGQEVSVKALTNALLRAKANGGAIHHQAFLFAGVRGTGKTSTARILARALNCVEGPTPTPCGVCDACQASELPDQNLDIMEIDAASRSSVEDARALREQVQTRPAFCRYRVYIIDEVHMMSRSAFDALLKILEEPPAHAVFVLATTELQDVPDTIKSRVQIFPFRLIPAPVIEARLKHVCEQEGVTFEADALRLLAEAGQGSMRDALTTLDRVIAAGGDRVGEALVREQLGIVPAVSIQAILEAVLAGDAPAILDHCQGLASLGADWISFWRELMLALRARMEADLRRGAAPHETLRWARLLQLLLQRERDLRDTSLPEVVVELALVTASQLPYLAPLDALVRAAPPGAGSASGGPPGGASSGGSSGSSAPVPAAPRPVPPATGVRPPAPSAPPPAPGPSRNLNPGPAPVAAPPSSPTSRSGAPRPDTALPVPAAVTPGPPPAPLSAPIPPPAPAARPPVDPRDPDQLRRTCSDALKQAPGGLPRTLGALPHMALELSFRGGTLHWLFPPDVRNTVQDLEKEQDNPHLLEALGRVLPGLARMAITFSADNQPRPEDALRANPDFQRLLADTGGEVVEIRRAEA